MLEELGGNQGAGPDDDVGAGQALGTPQGDEVHGAGTGADEGDHAVCSLPAESPAGLLLAESGGLLLADVRAGPLRWLVAGTTIDDR